jgi:ribosome-binding factor A
VRRDDSQPSRRVQRVASRLKFLISHIILRELSDPRIGLVTILEVKPTEYLKEAKVYVSVFGSAGEKSKAQHALLQARGFIQNEVGRNLETRNTPILRFVFDDSADKASRIGALIHQVSQEDREATMAKKPSKKTNKPDHEAGTSSKRPPKKGGSPVSDDEDDDEEEAELDEEKEEVGDDSSFDAKSDEDFDVEADADFEKPGVGAADAKEEDFEEEGVDEEVADEVEDDALDEDEDEDEDEDDEEDDDDDDKKDAYGYGDDDFESDTSYDE